MQLPTVFQLAPRSKAIWPLDSLVGIGFRGKSYGQERIKARIQIPSPRLAAKAPYFDHQSFTSNNRSVWFSPQWFASRKSAASSINLLIR
ncbi:hypothetical protein CMK14_03355 [Candidatus Poribacteria bacterium]|nr:hypothetical protein [Candidatus Poribacteria bacterium]